MKKNFQKIIVIILFFTTLLSACSQNKIEKKSILNPISINNFEENTLLQLVDIGDTKLAVRHHKGLGTPLVFIHGTLDDHSAWLSIASELTKTIPNPIILFDLRGHSSSKNSTNKQGSIIQDSDDVVKLIKKLGYDNAHLIGHSYGANITIKIANKYPEVPSSISLYEPPVFGLLIGDQKYKEGLQLSMKSIMTTQSLLEEGKIEEGVKLFIENLAFGDGSWNDELDDHTRSVMVSNFETFIDQSKDNERLSINVSKLNSYKGMITIIHGSKSLQHFSACVYELKKILDNEKVIMVTGAKHSGIFTHSEQISKIISDNMNLK